MTRYYFALTNFCNRSCELCSCYSDPSKKTFIDADNYFKYLTDSTEYEAQLEGGEPLLHPQFYAFLKYLQDDSRCQRVILCTNTVKMPWRYKNNGVLDEESSLIELKTWFKLFAAKAFVLKPSINKHLIDKDAQHYMKMVVLKSAWDDFLWPKDSELVFNVRRLKNKDGSEADNDIVDMLNKHELVSNSQVYFYQRYGKAENNLELDLPYIISNPVDFHLISPDGLDWQQDLIARAAHMKNMK